MTIIVIIIMGKSAIKIALFPIDAQKYVKASYIVKFVKPNTIWAKYLNVV